MLEAINTTKETIGNDTEHAFTIEIKRHPICVPEMGRTLMHLTVNQNDLISGEGIAKLVTASGFLPVAGHVLAHALDAVALQLDEATKAEESTNDQAN